MPEIAYIDLDPCEMMHWKYIKREKLPNGKWRYYYDQSELDKMSATARTKTTYADSARRSYDTAVKDRLAAQQKKDRRKTKAQRATYEGYHRYQTG